MALDAIIISDASKESFSAVSPFRLKIDGRIALIQVISNYLKNNCEITPPIIGDNHSSWASSPKLNGIYLHNYLSKNNFEVALIDSYFEEKAHFKRLLQQSPRTIIISTTFICLKKQLNDLVVDIRSEAPDIRIIVGGPFVYHSFLLSQKINDPDYDTESAATDYLFLESSDEPAVDIYIISTRGEKTLCETLKRINDNRSYKDLPNTAFFDSGQYVFNNLVDEFSFTKPAEVNWEYVPDELFENGVIPVQSSNGCIYKCTFCNFTKDRRLNYIKPIDALVAELSAVSKKNIRYVRFTDDSFRLGQGNLTDFCVRLIKEELPIRWMSFFRASDLENVDLQLLKQAGCIEVQMGLESANHQVLINMNKRISPERYSAVIGDLLACGINCSCCFIFGFPGETEHSIDQTIDFIKNLENPTHEGILTWSIFPFILVPLSPIYEKKLRSRYNLRGYMTNWQHDSMDSAQAIEAVKRAFLEIDNSSPMYLGDNLDMLLSMPSQIRKKFYTTRHQLSQMGMKHEAPKLTCCETFKSIFS